MAIEDNKKLDLLWKKVGYGVTETSPNKSAPEESIASPSTIMGSQVWSKSSEIPAVAAPVSGIVEYHAIQLIPDNTVAGNKTWLAVKEFANGNTPNNRVRDFISFTHAPSYEVRVFRDAARTQRLLPGVSNQEWVFDYSAGVLWFPNNLPAGVTSLFLTGFAYVGPKGVGNVMGSVTTDTLNVPTSGDYEGGFIEGWEPGVTLVADAFDNLNKILNQVVPGAPPSIAENSVSILGGTEGTDIPLVLAGNYTSNLGNFDEVPAVGQTIKRVFEPTVNTDVVGPFGSSKSGSVVLEFNDSIAGTVDLTQASDVGVYDKLHVLTDGVPPNGSGAFQQATISGRDLEPATGLNYVRVIHTGHGATAPAYFVRDPSTTKPTVSAITVSVDPESFNAIYSSGIPHLVRGAIINANATVSNLATQVALASHNVEFTTIPKNLIRQTFVSPGAYGLPNPIPRSTNVTLTGVPLVIDDALGTADHGAVQIQARARNANGASTAVGTRRINIMREGTTSFGGYVDENSVPVLNLGEAVVGSLNNAVRIALGATNTPAYTINEINNPWDSFQAPALWEASVVGGGIIRDLNDYTQYIPAGPNNSNKNDTQFITFAFRRQAVSQMIIDVSGSYTGLWISLPGIPGQTTSVNRWWDAKKRYEGFGTPGAGITDGCALGEPALGFTQKVHVTFGQQSSSNSTSNYILVRFSLRGTQRIGDLKFTGV